MHRGDPHLLVVLVDSFRYRGPRLFTGYFFCPVSLVCAATIRRKTVVDLDNCLLERRRTRYVVLGFLAHLEFVICFAGLAAWALWRLARHRSKWRQGVLDLFALFTVPVVLLLAF